MKKQKIIITLICSLFIICGKVVGSDKKDTKTRPNIIFIFADDWGYGDIGKHGSSFCKTPNLDRMIDEGMDFSNFTVNHPVCSPSRTAVMTGQFPARHSIHRHFANIKHHIETGMPDWLDPTAPMLPRMLKNAGYKTGHFGKWHLTNSTINDAPMPEQYGYDEYAAFNIPGEQIKTSEAVPEALKFIRKNKNKPFFVNLWLHETHLPHFPLQEYLEQFKDLDERKKVYAAVVAEGDAGVGAVLDLLKELNIDENTLVIFSSDNGPEWPGKENHKKKGKNGLGSYYCVGETGGLKGQKRSLFAGGVRVPFIVHWPNVVPAGKINTSSVITAVDILPTFLDIAGLDLPKSYSPDGESFLPAIKGEGFKREKPIFWEWKGMHNREYLWPHLGIRKGKWKLITNKKLGKTELYNLEEDWAEHNNVSEANPDIVKELYEILYDWKETLPREPKASCISNQRKSNN
ncbi:N-acetylgalactosamine 6-sulfate sulfatase (GALNS) [Puteibacter caeruleilacunae]|nr:N-acetylgalactosamine 6-sulfate sulfatase (GALNS) [Puteibacter caeruleilacunae]